MQIAVQAILSDSHKPVVFLTNQQSRALRVFEQAKKATNVQAVVLKQVFGPHSIVVKTFFAEGR